MYSKETNWLKINRGIINHWIWQDANKFKWWIDLLFMASYESRSVYHNIRMIPLDRGQLIASISFLCGRWQVSKPTIIGFLKLLEDEEMISRSVYHNVAIITIKNYESYQARNNSPIENPNGSLSASYERESIRPLDNSLDNFFDKSVDPLIDNQNGSLSASYERESIRPLDNSLDNSLDPNKRNIKKLYNYNNKNMRAHEEQEFYEALRKNRMWQEQAICMKHHINVEECIKFINEFELDCMCQNMAHKGLQDVYRHFSNWLSKHQNKQKVHNERNQQSDKRRGTEVSASSAKDYTTSF